MAREFTYYQAEVVDIQVLGPHLRRLVLGGEAMREWRSSGQPDEAMLLVFPDSKGTVVLPDAEDGTFERTRWYTVRRFDEQAGELTVDIVSHDVGLATRWARRAKVGDTIGISSTHHWFDRPDDAEWQVLAGDLTALPAISRILEERTGDLPTRVLIEVPSADDVIDLEAAEASNVDIEWVVIDGDSRLAEFTGGVEMPATPGYHFVVGECGETRDVRRCLRHELGLKGTRYTVVGYWRARRDEWMAKYNELNIAAELEALYAAAEAEGTDREALEDEVDRRLIEAGL